MQSKFKNESSGINGHTSTIAQVSIGLMLGITIIGIGWGSLALHQVINYFAVVIGLICLVIIIFLSHKYKSISPLKILNRLYYILAMLILLMITAIVKHGVPITVFQDRDWVALILENYFYGMFNVLPAIFPIIIGLMVMYDTYKDGKKSKGR